MSLRSSTFEQAKGQFKPLRRSPIRCKTPIRSQNGLKRAERRNGGKDTSDGNLATQGLNSASGKPRKRLSAKPDPELAAWGRRIHKRDGYRCCWPAGCQTGDKRIDPHHISPRARRPDLRLVDENGIDLCRTHHDWCHDNPLDAERMGLLSSETYESVHGLKVL